MVIDSTRLARDGLKKIRFTLRVLIVGHFFVGGIFGVWSHKRYEHEVSQAKISQRGGVFYNGFSDPIGPNWIWRSHNTELPTDGAFSNFFTRWLCINGGTSLRIEHQEFDEKTFQYVARLVNLETLHLFAPDVSPKSLRLIPKSVRRLILVVPDWKREYSEEVASLHQLDYLHIETARADLPELEPLKRITHLECLYLDVTDAAPNDFKSIQQCFRGVGAIELAPISQ